MKILLLCGMILAGALFAEAATGRELCSLTNQEFKKLLKCMGDHVHPELQETVRQENVALSVRSAYAACKPVKN
ncbi:hypothetical protein MRX96_012419 [Rhipicephalus microplus]